MMEDFGERGQQGTTVDFHIMDSHFSQNQQVKGDTRYPQVDMIL